MNRACDLGLAVALFGVGFGALSLPVIAYQGFNRVVAALEQSRSVAVMPEPVVSNDGMPISCGKSVESGSSRWMP